MDHLKLNPTKFAIAGGILGALSFAYGTALAVLGVPGFVEFADFLAQMYGAWGYSLSWTGVLIGAVYGFVEGFVHIGILGWVYNRLL